MLRSFRYLLFPVSLIHAFVLLLRNYGFDKGWFTVHRYNFPLICVGNLATGGTGKTPMVEWLVGHFKDQYRIATLSRGYKRKTRGFGIASDQTTALEIGDEPMLFHQKFPHITVAVGEERAEAIPHLLQDRPDTELIILDDAFQHRSVHAGLNIVLSEYRNLFTRDFIFPSGDLRDLRKSARRAEILVVTKCPPLITTEEMNQIRNELARWSKAQVLFSCLAYGTPKHLFQEELRILKGPVLLVCGIANPRPLKEYLNQQVTTYDMLRFPDHHIFDTDDLNEILKQFKKIQSEGGVILTTEKDGVRLKKFKAELSDIPIYELPVQHEFLQDGADLLLNQVLNFMSQFPRRTAPTEAAS